MEGAAWRVCAGEAQIASRGDVAGRWRSRRAPASGIFIGDEQGLTQKRAFRNRNYVVELVGVEGAVDHLHLEEAARIIAWDLSYNPLAGAVNVELN